MPRQVVRKDVINWYLVLCMVIYSLIIFFMFYFLYKWLDESIFYFIRNLSFVFKMLDYLRAGVLLSFVFLVIHFLIVAIEMITSKRYFSWKYFLFSLLACVLNAVLMYLVFADITSFLYLATTEPNRFISVIKPYIFTTTLALVLLYVNVFIIYRKEKVIGYQ